MKKYSNMVSFIAISLVFLLLIGVNYNSYISAAQTAVWKLQGNSDIHVQEAIESTLKDNFKYRNELIDVYGTTKKILGENIIGKYEYVKDESGIMQHILGQNIDDKNNYITSIKNLLEKLNECDIPCVDVNLPDRGQNFSAANEFEYNCKRNRDVEDQIIIFGVDEFNVQERLIDTEVIPHNDFFFHTDVHLTTRAEFLIAKYLTEYLTDKYSIVFPNSDIVYNSDMYDWQDHDFCGNFCASSGKYFANIDNFQTFVPKFETELKLTFPDGNVKQGNFIDVMTNQYGEGTPYWVTNYGQWPTLYYTYDNLQYPQGPKLLVLYDSIFMRANTFLALNSSRLTVLDPRYINGNEYIVDCLLDDDYDAIIICHTDYFNNNLFLSNVDIPENILPGSEISYKGMWLDNVNTADLNSGGYTQGEIPISLYQDSQTVFLNGWAADFNANMPLSALYIKVGDKTVKCQYGIERTSVSDYFQNENLKMTGFNVTIPKSYLDVVDKIEFIQVGNDGTYRFESVEYKVVDTGSFDNNLVLGNIDRDAQIISNTAPLTVNHTDSYDIDITVKNTGNTPWAEKDGIRLCIWQDGVDYGYRVVLEENETVEPGEEHTFRLSGFVLPELSLTVLEFQMVKEGIAYFGEREAVSISAKE